MLWGYAHYKCFIILVCGPYSDSEYDDGPRDEGVKAYMGKMIKSCVFFAFNKRIYSRNQ